MATHLVPDKLGRIVLPPYLRTHAGLSGEVVVAGVYDRVEVWDRATWDAVRAEFLNGDSTRLENLAGSLSRGTETA
jgi:MraZ protein